MHGIIVEARKTTLVGDAWLDDIACQLRDAHMHYEEAAFHAVSEKWRDAHGTSARSNTDLFFQRIRVGIISVASIHINTNIRALATIARAIAGLFKAFGKLGQPTESAQQAHSGKKTHINTQPVSALDVNRI